MNNICWDGLGSSGNWSRLEMYVPAFPSITQDSAASTTMLPSRAVASKSKLRTNSWKPSSAVVSSVVVTSSWAVVSADGARVVLAVVGKHLGCRASSQFLLPRTSSNPHSNSFLWQQRTTRKELHTELQLSVVNGPSTVPTALQNQRPRSSSVVVSGAGVV